MPRSRAVTPARKPASRYHHGDLPRAMLQEAVRTIQTHGVDALTLRGVAERLGVSRTALYRHFVDKQALLAAVAAEGFRMFRTALIDAWDTAGRGREGFDAMAVAYVRFAVTHPSHYRVMFGGVVQACDASPVPSDAGTDAFQVLVDAIVEQQEAGLVRNDNALQLARFIWAVVHGVAMLALDGVLSVPEANTLVKFANERLHTGIAA
jgi:AcrR family transcriptional regulator